jgi:hypothetical protein
MPEEDWPMTPMPKSVLALPVAEPMTPMVVPSPVEMPAMAEGMIEGLMLESFEVVGPVAVLVTLRTPLGAVAALVQLTGRLMAPPPLTVWQPTVPVLPMEAMALPEEQELATRA